MEKLDSCAIAQLTHDVDSDILSTIKKLDEKSLQELKDSNGLVGLAEEGGDKINSAESPAIEQQNNGTVEAEGA